MGGKACEGRPGLRSGESTANADELAEFPPEAARPWVERCTRDGVLPARYKCIIRAAVCLATGRYALAGQEALAAIKMGATPRELVEGLLSSSSGWHMLH